MFGPDITGLAEPDGPHGDAYRAYMRSSDRMLGGDYVPLWFLRNRMTDRLRTARVALDELDPFLRDPETGPVLQALDTLREFLKKEFDPHDHRLRVLAVLLGSEEIEADREARREVGG